MGSFNTLDVTVVCELCKEEYESRLQFKAGECWQYHYKVGDSVKVDPKDPAIVDLEIVADSIIENPVCPSCRHINPEDYDIYLKNSMIVGFEIQSEISHRRHVDEFDNKHYYVKR
jgi:hypothetical protein